jgi:hypothetical protein
MRTLRLIISVTVLLPFLLSATGILVIQSHCSCTGKDQVSLYLPPESCSNILEDHKHLFEFHAGDLAHCCNLDDAKDCSAGDGHYPACDCGCANPEARFFQLDHEFTEEKIANSKILVFRELPEFIVFELLKETNNTVIYNQRWIKDPPPLISAYNSYIYFICNPKIPSIA